MFLIINCQKATRLVEERADKALPFKELAALALHLAYCPYCKRYAQQSALLGQLALFTAQSTVASTTQLPPAARVRIQQRLDAARTGPADEKGPTAL